jgi:hypothetical protein
MTGIYENIDQFIKSTFRHKTFEYNEWLKCSASQSTNDSLLILINGERDKVITILLNINFVF